MRYLFLSLVFVWNIGQICAQTKPIAYKSHAGDMDFFVPEHQPEDDFGNPPPQILKFIKINDSTVVEVLNDWGGPNFTDTVVNHPHFKDPTMSLDEIKTKYHYRADIQFIGFEEQELPKTKPIEKKPEEKLETPGDQKPKACPVPEEKETSKKGKKKKVQKKDKAEVLPIAANNNLPPDNAGNYLPWIASAGVAYLFLLAFLVWKRQREKLMVHA